MNTRAFMLSALIAGLVIGLLGSLPLINFVNCLLCLWVWVGGFFAVYLYRRNTPGGVPLTLAQGTGLGAAAGVIGAFIGLLVYLATGALTMPMMNELARTLEIDLPQQSGGFGDTLIGGLIFLVIDLVLYPLFGAIAGLLGANLLWKKPSQPA